MNYLILPDVHTRWETAERIINHHANDVDKVVFLGDYFDDFYDTPQLASETADWFRHSINQPNRIHLCGNHDVHYWFKDCNEVRCSGYDQFKSIAINDIVTKDDWEKLVFFYVIDDTWLLSHGGVHPHWLNINNEEGPTITLPQVVERLERDSKVCVKNLYRRNYHWFIQEGFARSSCPCYGGLLWCDWNQEFHPVMGINQIVGHTPNPDVSWIFRKRGDARSQIAPLGVVPKLGIDVSYNLDLDSHPGSRFYALYVDGKLEIKQTKNVK